MPDGQPIDPGDVREALQGKTVEAGAHTANVAALEEKIAEAERARDKLVHVQELFGFAVDRIRQDLAEAKAAIERASAKLSELENRLR